MISDEARNELWRQAEDLLRQGNLTSAAPALERALAVAPKAIGFRNLAVVRLQFKQPQLALTACDAALKLAPLDHDAIGLRGDILFALERFADAIDSYREATRLQPSFSQAWANMGVALLRLGQSNKALMASEQAFRLAPDRPAFAIQFGTLLVSEKRFSDGRATLERVLRHLEPTFEIAQSLFAACHGVGDPSAALTWLEAARKLKPDDANTEYNRGIILTELGRLDDALAAYRNAAILDPTNPEPVWNASLLLLRTGQWKQAWPLFESRLRRSTRKDYGPAINAIPRWSGEATSDRKRILLLAEQGLGDTLMFCRYAPLVAERGYEVSILAQAPLRTLLSRARGIDRVCDEQLNPGDFDYRIELMSLPGIFGTREDAIPFSKEPYLFTDPRRIKTWDAKIMGARRPLAGLMWRGRKNPWLTERSISLGELTTKLPKNLSYISLQKSLLPDELSVAASFNLETHDGSEVDFEDAAAIIQLVDLVITIDTSIAHLAGALGARTLLLLPENPDWRWKDFGEESSWYHNVRLVRFQTERAYDNLEKRIDSILTQARGATTEKYR